MVWFLIEEHPSVIHTSHVPLVCVPCEPCSSACLNLQSFSFVTSVFHCMVIPIPNPLRYHSLSAASAVRELLCSSSAASAVRELLCSSSAASTVRELPLQLEPLHVRPACSWSHFTCALLYSSIRKIHSLHCSVLISQTTIVVFKINSSFIFFQNYYLTILKLLEQYFFFLESTMNKKTTILMYGKYSSCFYTILKLLFVSDQKYYLHLYYL